MRLTACLWTPRVFAICLPIFPSMTGASIFVYFSFLLRFFFFFFVDFPFFSFFFFALLSRSAFAEIQHESQLALKFLDDNVVDGECNLFDYEILLFLSFFFFFFFIHLFIYLFLFLSLFFFSFLFFSYLSPQGFSSIFIERLTFEEKFDFVLRAPAAAAMARRYPAQILDRGGDWVSFGSALIVAIVTRGRGERFVGIHKCIGLFFPKGFFFLRDFILFIMC